MQAPRRSFNTQHRSRRLTADMPMTGTGFRIELTETMKRGGELLGQDREMPWTKPLATSRRRGRHAVAAGQTGLNAGKKRPDRPETALPLK